MSSEMGFNANEAAQAFNDALLHNDELKDALEKASKSVSEAFGNAGAVIGSTLGKVMETVWGDGSENYFKLKLSRETEYFLLYKVKPIIRVQENYTEESVNYYQKVNEEKE